MTAIRWATLATDDLDRIERWYRRINPDLASRMVSQILNVTRLLRDHPPPAPIERYGTRRKRQVAGTPCNLFYRVAGDHVRILRVLHVAQDQGRH